MIKAKPLKFCLFGLASIISFNFLPRISAENVIVNPEWQVVNEYEDIVIDCRDTGYGKVKWTRPKGLSLSKEALQKRGRLIINKIKYEDRGEYYCYNIKNHTRLAFVEVYRKTTTAATTQNTYPVTVGLPATKKPLEETTPYPCLYGTFNGTFCKNDLVEDFFDCANGKKINKSLVCNRVNNCDDGSDEAICFPWPPKITVLPKSNVKVYCGDQDKSNSGTLVLECESVGHPIPLVRWVKYEGHVPSKCQQYSKRGRGILTCPNFQQSDQGAYSCVAENTLKLAESQPKSLARCSNTIDCRGFKVLNEEQIEHCLECYCSGKTSICQNIKSNLTINKFSFPETSTEIFFKDNGEILFIPTKNDIAPSPEIRKSAHTITYCALSENELTETSFLKSFGRSIIIPKYKGKTNFFPQAPNLIIQGNGLSLIYTANLISPPRNSEMDLAVRFWPGNWHHLNKQAANRQDLMKVLSSVNTLFIRCEYEEGNSVKWGKNATIYLESSLITDIPNSVSYVEKCSCPSGYDGLSCESCAAGYRKKSKGNDFICERILPLSCKMGYAGVNCSDCDTIKGYYKKENACEKALCSPDGAEDPTPDFTGKCRCKNGVTGDNCDKCKNDSFYLHKARGCLKCWCSGITNQCKSSNLYRTVISNIPRGGYNSSDGRNFWLLPPNFSGNRLTSYGGYLNYTMKYKPGIPKENAYLTVEFLSKDDITFIYTHENVDKSTFKDEKSWSVPITEIKWKKSDRSSVTRGEFLTMMSKIKAVYIESPYHLSSGQANLTSARMSSAASFGDDDTPLALEVEQCICPLGYTGLSCESCSEGYYKKRNGTIIQCIKCNCAFCDPEFGCPDCPQLTYRDNPEEEKIPVCKPCPCNGNGVSCTKDDYNQIFCRCKSGFAGMHCENSISNEKDELTVTISPRRIYGKKIGSVVHMNCSFVTNEEMTLSAKKKYNFLKQSFMKSSNNDSGLVTNQGSRVSKSFEIVLEDGLEAIECLVHDIQGRITGHVIAPVEDLISVIKPVKITNCYSDTIVVRESESKDIICEATGSPTPIINWYQTVNGSPAKKVDTSKGVHSIESVSLNDNGTIYSCIAENSEGDKATCTILLIVRKKCEIISVFPKKVRVEEGKNFSVQCKTTPKSQKVNWSIWNQERQIENSVFNPRASIVEGSLQITNATLSDSGIYVCTAEGENGKISNNVSVTVEEKRIPPIVTIKEDDKILKEGESFVINCVATGKPKPTIFWKKFNDTLRSNVIVKNKTLTIERATTQNSGIYECEARSVAGNASSYISIEVEVQYPPQINISEEKIKAQWGDNVTVTCLAIGYPRPTLTWFAPNINLTVTSKKNDDMVLIEPFLSVKEEASLTVSKDMSDFTINCIAGNTAGINKIITQVKVLQPKIAINETVEFVPIGSNFVLNCEFPGKLNWTKIGGLVADECPVPNGLMITSVQNQHNGTYICNAEPDYEKIIHLIVTGFVPKFSRQSRSYLVLPVHLKSTNDIRVEMSFNPTRENGILLQKENQKLDVYLEKRKIHLSIYSSEGDFLDIEMKDPIELKKWNFLVVSISRNYVDITIYNENSTIHERQTERSKDFNITLGHGSDSFFVGGPVTKARHIPRFFSRRHSYFDGCISRLSIDNHEFDIVKEGSFSHNVTLCRRCSEEQNICSEKGKCLDAPTQYGFICVCPNESEGRDATCRASCAGKGCETQLDLCSLLNPCNDFSNKCDTKVYRLECECANSYSGTTCEKVLKYSFCAKGNGYVRLPSNLLGRHLGVPEIIDMSFTLHKQDGQLLWQGDKANYLSIAVRNGKLEYSYLNQHSKLEIHGAKEFALNKKHTLLIKRINNTVTVDVNWSNHIKAQSEVYSNFTDKIKTNRVTGDIYLGLIPNPDLRTGQHSSGLDGCIHYIAFREKLRINLMEKQLEEFNVFSPVKPILEPDDSDEVDYDDVDLEYDLEP